MIDYNHWYITKQPAAWLVIQKENKETLFTIEFELHYYARKSAERYHAVQAFERFFGWQVSIASRN